MRQRRGIDTCSLLRGPMAHSPALLKAGCRRLWQAFHRLQACRPLALPLGHSCMKQVAKLGACQGEPPPRLSRGDEESVSRQNNVH